MASLAELLERNPERTQRLTVAVREVNATIERFIQEASVSRKRRALAQPERQLAAKLRKAFLAQGRTFLTKMAMLKPFFPPEMREASPVPWEGLFDEAVLETLDAFAQPLGSFAEAALAAGIRAAVADLVIETSFTLEHPRAVAYLEQRGAARVTGITETTRKGLRRLLVRAAEEGWGYTKTAGEINRLYKGFAGPPLRVQPKHLRSRAEAIAVYELGDAYEAGTRVVVDELAASFPMQKAWLSVRDSKVRAEHAANDAAGWIDLNATFPSGDDRPPSDPGCRCSALYRRRPEEP